MKLSKLQYFTIASIIFPILKVVKTNHTQTLLQETSSYLKNNILLSKCLKSLLNRLITPGSKVIVTLGDGVTNELIDNILTSTIKPLNLSIVLTTKNLSSWLDYYNYLDIDPRTIEKPQYQLIFAPFVYQIEETLFSRYQELNWTPHGKIIFVIFEEFCNSLPCLDKFTTEIAKLFIRNFIILIKIGDKLSILTVTTLKNCFKNVPAEEIAQCSLETMQPLKLSQINASLFDPVNYDYFRNCEIKIKRTYSSYPQAYSKNDEYDFKSFDGLAVRSGVLLTQLMHLNVSETHPLFPWCDWPGETGHPYGAPLTGNKYGIYDPVFFICFWLQPLGSCYPWNILDYILQNDLVIVITREYALLPSWHIFLDIFEWNEWILLVTTFCSVSTVWIVLFDITRKQFHTKRHSNHGQVILNLFASMFGIPIRFHLKFFHLRIVLATWLVYAIFFTIVLTSGYTELLANPPRKQQVHTLREVVERNMPLEVRKRDVEIIRLYAESIRPNMYVGANDGQLFNESNAYFRQEGGAAYVSPYFFSMGLLEQGKLSDPRETFRPIATIEESLLPTFMSLALPIKGHVWTLELNHRIHRAHAAGLTLKITKDQFRRAEVIHGYVEVEAVDALNLNDYIGPLVICGFLSFFSFISFFLELFFNRFFFLFDFRI